MSADRLSLMIEQHSVLLFARAMRRSADEHRLAAQHDDEAAAELVRRAQEIARYLDQEATL